MAARYLALLILLPFTALFVYATWHEYKRFKSEGRSSYGLSYDPETNTTTVGAMAQNEESYDLDAFDADLRETGADDRSTETASADTENPDADDKPQDTRT